LFASGYFRNRGCLCFDNCTGITGVSAIQLLRKSIDEVRTAFALSLAGLGLQGQWKIMSQMHAANT
jgi:hypothetical protein